jgi:hypothetical protein
VNTHTDTHTHTHTHTHCTYQFRTGHSWLATHGKLHQFREDDKCECGAAETAVDVLVDCPRLKVIRQELRRKIGIAFNDISDMLGRGSQGKKGKGDDMQGGTVLLKIESTILVYSFGPQKARELELEATKKK